MAPIVCSTGLGKRYRVSQSTAAGAYGYRTLRDDLVHWFTAPIRRLRGEAPQESTHDFWALRDVQFEIQPGEVVGVIGPNGAGKSTLLKILSRITKPTTGQIELRGRVGSLLEVGTGFHPELTGKENIFLNGAILGMKRQEIARKFDQIVEFAEIEKFLDTPVKRYSSGMYVRLAFAVAAHLEPEILIVDEVLAVGDMAFQRKCMGRMAEVGKSGCTVLFVSHNMPAIESLCTRAILLAGGHVVNDGAVSELVADYHRRVIQPHKNDGVSLAERNGVARKQKLFRLATLLDEAGEPTNFLQLGRAFHLRIDLMAPIAIEYPTITIGIDDTLGHRLLSLCTPLSQPAVERLEGSCQIDCRVEQFPLAPGEYWLKLGLATPGMEIDEVDRVLHFSVTNGEAFGEGRGIHRGLCVAPSRWTLLSSKPS